MDRKVREIVQVWLNSQHNPATGEGVTSHAGADYVYLASARERSSLSSLCSPEDLEARGLIRVTPSHVEISGPNGVVRCPFCPDWTKTRRRIEDRLRKDLQAVVDTAMRLGISIADAD